MKVWCVWTEDGEYETYTHDLRGIFATRELAESHAAQLRADRHDSVEVVEEAVLDAVPTRVTRFVYAAHITADGTEDKGQGYSGGVGTSEWWSNELRPMDSSSIKKWTSVHDPRPDLVIRAEGSDRALVAAEYARLLAEARRRLSQG